MPKLQLKRKDRNNKVREVGTIEIKNQSEESADLCFFGDINSESMGAWKEYYPEDKAPSDVKEFLDQLENVSKINVHINSGGGSVFGGIAIHNMLKRFDAEITVYVEGIAASIASVIAMAGDRIIIPANAQMMIHKPMSVAWGNADEMRKEADVLDGCQKVILSCYMEHAKDGITEEEINDLINAETWMSGDGWQKYFDIEVGESSQAVAATSDYFDTYNNLPKNLAEHKPEPAENTAEQIAALVIEAIKDKITPAEPEEHKEPANTLTAESILKDLDYL